MHSIRAFRESPWEQGEDEAIAYTVDTTPWGGGSGSPAVVVKLGGNDVTGEKTDGAASGNGDTVTTPVIRNLVAGEKYRVEVTWTTSGGQVVEAYGYIDGKE